MRKRTYNMHSHATILADAGNRFLGLLSEWIKKKPEKRGKIISWLLDGAIPGKKDRLSKYAQFLRTQGKTRYQVYLNTRQYYKQKDIITVLTVDLENMGAGSVDCPYIQQVKETLMMRRNDPYMRVFIMVHPRSQWLEELKVVFEDNVEWISGIKHYPLQGYTVNDPALSWFNDWAILHEKSFIIHGTPENEVHYRGKDIRKLLEKIPENFPYLDLTGKNNKELCANFGHPWHAYELARKTGRPVCIAHLAGSDLPWKDYVYTRMSEGCESKLVKIYVDCSFTCNTKEEQNRLKNELENLKWIRPFVLYGDDWPMPETENAGNPFPGMEKILGQEWFELIANTNPQKFLNE